MPHFSKWGGAVGAESVCIGGIPHTWIKVGEHKVSEPWSDKQFITYLVADFECSGCGMKKEEEVEKEKYQTRHWR